MSEPPNNGREATGAVLLAAVSGVAAVHACRVALPTVDPALAAEEADAFFVAARASSALLSSMTRASSAASRCAADFCCSSRRDLAAASICALVTPVTVISTEPVILGGKVVMRPC